MAKFDPRIDEPIDMQGIDLLKTNKYLLEWMQERDIEDSDLIIDLVTDYLQQERWPDFRTLQVQLAEFISQKYIKRFIYRLWKDLQQRQPHIIEKKKREERDKKREDSQEKRDCPELTDGQLSYHNNYLNNHYNRPSSDTLHRPSTSTSQHHYSQNESYPQTQALYQATSSSSAAAAEAARYDHLNNHYEYSDRYGGASDACDYPSKRHRGE